MKDVFELATRYVAPSIRRHLARELVRRGMARADAARILNLSRSAITRYIKSERGAGIRLTRFSDVTQMIKELATKILKNELDKSQIQERIAEITAYILSKKYFCTYHKKLDPEIDILHCNLCPTIFINMS
jgi:predicted transcriptional regulator